MGSGQPLGKLRASSALLTVEGTSLSDFRISLFSAKLAQQALLMWDMLAEQNGVRSGFWAPLGRPQREEADWHPAPCLSFPVCPGGGVPERSSGEAGRVHPLPSPHQLRPRGCPEKVPRSLHSVQPSRGRSDAGPHRAHPGPGAWLPQGLPARLPGALQEAPGEPEHPPAAALHRGPSAVVRREEG